MTNNDIAVGEAALKAYVQRIEGWKAAFIPEQAERDGAIMIIREWDLAGEADNTDAIALKKAACGMALYQAISKAGYANQVTPEQCAQATDEVMAAVNKARGNTAARS